MEMVLWAVGLSFLIVTGLVSVVVLKALFGKDDTIITNESKDSKGEYLLEKQEWSDNFYATVNRVYYLEYADSQGELTDRKVKVKWIEKTKAGDLVLRCDCYLRNEDRSFRVDKIINLKDAKKKRIDNPLAFFTNWGVSKPAA